MTTSSAHGRTTRKYPRSTGLKVKSDFVSIIERSRIIPSILPKLGPDERSSMWDNGRGLPLRRYRNAGRAGRPAVRQVDLQREPSVPKRPHPSGDRGRAPHVRRRLRPVVLRRGCSAQRVPGLQHAGDRLQPAALPGHQGGDRPDPGQLYPDGSPPQGVQVDPA